MRINPFPLTVLLAAMLLAGTAQAAQPSAETRTKPDIALRLPAPVSDRLLSQMRGGFQLDNGMVASFGITRAVYINGVLVASTRINIPDLSHIDAAQANALASLLGGVTLIRNGPGNFVDPAAFDRAIGAIVIQNSLDGQQIQAVTTLNATVKNLNEFNSMNLANSLQQVLINSRGQ